MRGLIAGVDEAGRGPLAGPVITAAVILPKDCIIKGLSDSKKLSEQRREKLYDIIIHEAICWATGRAEVAEIDQLNILQATLLAMRRAVEGLEEKPDHIQVDGNHCPDMDGICTVEAIISGDDSVPAISAASIIAKVTRDREMRELHERFPEYGFARHKGYPVKEHLQALEKYGVLSEHRKSFAPVRKRIKNN